MTVDEVKQKLQEMVDVDQAGRMQKPIDWEKMEKIDRANTQTLQEIISEYGWPVISKFGEEAAHNAWLLAQHADRTFEVQEHFLELMLALPAEEVSAKDVAYLTDRVMLKREGKQKYGTQLTKHTGKSYLVLRPLLDKVKLDEWRAEAGLGPVREYLTKSHWEEDGGAYVDDEDYEEQTKNPNPSA